MGDDDSVVPGDGRRRGQPPIWLMLRRGRTNVTWPIMCPAHLSATQRRIAAGQLVVGRTAAQQVAQVDLVDREQARRAARPSAVSRMRSQASQNGRVTDGMTPTSPRPSR